MPGPPKGYRRPSYSMAMVRAARDLYAAGMSLEETRTALQDRFALNKRPSYRWVQMNVDTRSPSEGQQVKVLGARREKVAREALRMVAEGKTGVEICDSLEITKDMLRSLCGDMRPSRSRSISRSWHKRDPRRLEKQKLARELREKGWTSREIGRRVGASKTAVMNWLRAMEAVS